MRSKLSSIETLLKRVEVKFSIVTAVWNNLEMLKGALDSVASQADVELEHIVIDGDSSDGTKEYFQSLASNNDVKFYSEKDKGIYDALNKGFRRANFDIIGLLHSDDLFFNNKVLLKVRKEFENGADVVYGDLNYVMKNNTGKIFREWKAGAYHDNELLFGWMPPHPTVFFKKELLEKTGFFDINFKIAADYDFIWRLFSIKGLNIHYIPEVLVLMRVGGASNKSVSSILRKTGEDIKITKRYSYSPIGTVLLKNLRKIHQLKLF